MSGSPAAGQAGPGRAGRAPLCLHRRRGLRAPQPLSSQSPFPAYRPATPHGGTRMGEGPPRRRSPAGGGGPGDGGAGAGREGGKPGPGAGSGAPRRRARRRAAAAQSGCGKGGEPGCPFPRAGSRRQGRGAAPEAPEPRVPPAEEAAAASLSWRRAEPTAGPPRPEVRRGGSCEETCGARAVRGPAAL